MAIKKTGLHSSLRKSCDELRGGMDASQYQDYVLALLFVKYVSGKHARQRDALTEDKGWRSGAGTVSGTRNEILTGISSPEPYILAVVQ